MRLLLSLLVVFSAVQRWTMAQRPRIAVATVAEGKLHTLSGNSLRLICDVPQDPSPLWTFKWFFNGKPLISSKSHSIWNARVLQSGNYTCSGARESELSETGILESQLSAPLRVDIDGGWVILDAPDKAMIMEETMYLTCRIRGHRLPKEVSFFLNGREIMRQLPSTLVVRNLTVNQGGEYSCRATWEVRGSYHSAESTAVPVTVLEILQTPELVVNITQVEKKRTDLKLTCLTELNTRDTTVRPIHYYFLKNDTPLSTAMSHHTFTISHVDSKNSGLYSCRVSVPSLNRENWSAQVQVNIPRFR